MAFSQQIKDNAVSAGILAFAVWLFIALVNILVHFGGFTGFLAGALTGILVFVVQTISELRNSEDTEIRKKDEK